MRENKKIKSEMSEKIAKKMEMIQNLRGVDVMKKKDLMMLMICHVVNILSSMMMTTMRGLPMRTNRENTMAG